MSNTLCIGKGEDALAALRHFGLAKPGEPLRLHLGCGEQRLEGYVNIDYPPARHEIMDVRADVHADILDLAFPEQSVDEIRLHHVFEHFDRVIALGLLLRWHLWLRPGGLLRIETPDLEGSAAELTSPGPFSRKMAAVRHLAGDHASSWGLHLEAYFPERLLRTLETLGFEAVRTRSWRWDREPYLCNVEVVASKGAALALGELLERAARVLRWSMVHATEEPAFQAWERRLDAFMLAGPEGGAKLSPTFPAPAGPADIKEIHDFNQRARDAWVRARAAEIPSGSRVLDVGAGTCPYRKDFAHCAYVAQDFMGLPDIRLDGRVGYGPIDVVSEASALPFAGGVFDVVLCTEVLEHVPDPAAVVREMARTLRPGGLLLLTTPLGCGLHQEPHHHYGGFTPHWYRRVLDECGLDALGVTPNGGFFKHLAQECARVSWLAETDQGLRERLGAETVALFAQSLPRLLYSLDADHFVEGFTVGYFVEARKRPAAALD